MTEEKKDLEEKEDLEKKEEGIIEDNSQDVEEDSNEETSEEKKDDKNEKEEELKNQLMRLQADFMNYKRRSEEEKRNSMNYAIEKFALELFPVLDNFERALDSQEDKEDSLYKGVKLIYDEINKVLEKNNIEEIQSLNEEFDPNLHHAVFMEESDQHKENIVTEVLQKGYKMKDKVIRPTMVKVSK